MTPIADFASYLRSAIEEAKAAGLHAAGLHEAAIELEDRAFSVYTTSSEWLGETKLAIATFRRQCEGKIPEGVNANLLACLHEISKAWPA